MGIPEIPDVDHGVGFKRCRSNKFRGLFSVRRVGEIRIHKSHLFRIPSHRTDSFPAHVVQGQAFPLRLHIPHGHESRIATGNQDMRNLLIPVQAFDIVGTGSGASQSERVLDIIQIGDVELRKTISQMINRSGACDRNTSPFAPPVARRLGCLGLNWSALIAPECLEALEIIASLFSGIISPAQHLLIVFPVRRTLSH